MVTMLLLVACQFANSWFHSSRIDDITDLFWLLILQHRRWRVHPCHVIYMYMYCVPTSVHAHGPESLDFNWHSDSLSEDSYTQCNSNTVGGGIKGSDHGTLIVWWASPFTRGRKGLVLCLYEGAGRQTRYTYYKHR